MKRTNLKEYEVDVWYVATIKVKALNKKEAEQKAIWEETPYDYAMLDHMQVWETN